MSSRAAPRKPSKPSNEHSCLEAALAYASAGWPVLPLHWPDGDGCSCSQQDCAAVAKHPLIASGREHSLASTDPEVINAWWAKWPRANVAIVTGPVSRLIVVDVDPRNRGERPAGLPDTVQALTGGGGTHDLYRIPEGVVIRKRKLVDGVDLKSAGGYIVAAPSVHASGKRYEWEASSAPWDIDVAPAPDALLQSHPPVPHQNLPAPDEPLDAGRRNDSLMRMAGAMRRQGMDASSIYAALRETNKKRCRPPLPDREVRSIATGVTRYEPASSMRAVLVPGRHAVIGPEGEAVYTQVTDAEFAAEALCRLPGGALYRKSNIVGELYAEPNDPLRFRPVSRERAAIILSRHLEFTVRKVKEKKDELVDVTEIINPLPQNLVGLVLAEGWTSADVRELRRLVTYPVVLGDDCEVATPGWNAEHRTYFDAEKTIHPIPWDDDAERDLDDLIVDFPFQTEADRQNFIGLLVAIVVRPIIVGPVPMHLGQAAIERTGKGKLMSELVGHLFFGRGARVPVMAMGRDDSEVDKRITALLLGGEPMCCIDNISDRVDSPSLAMLLTSTDYQSRILGQSKTVILRHEMMVLATGNNVRASAEIGKRVVPIRLVAKEQRPDMRTDFRHADLPTYVEGVRERILGILLGMIRGWVDAGKPMPLAGTALGGFEGWQRVVGGIMAHAGFGEWMHNREDWLDLAEDETDERQALVDAWWEKFGGTPRSAVELIGVAQGTQRFGWVFERNRTEAGQGRALGIILRGMVGQTYRDGVKCEYRRTGNGRTYRLVQPA